MLTTRSTDLEDLISKGIPYQRNGVVFVRGDALQKTASVELEEGMAALNLSPEAKDANATTQKSQINPNLKEADQVKNEQHWMTMWKDAKTELKKLREELKGETDEEIKDELKSDIDCLKKKKDEWAMLLGMK
jgi:protein subunit release factor A